MNTNENNRYHFHTIEPKWRHYWQEINLYRTGNDPEKPDFYILDYFPYPSGDGLSIGHGRNYVPTCVSARFHRMRGYNVLHPMGWDAFGLPAENYAVKHHIHPRESTKLFCDTYKRQMKLLECSYDWSREINSTDPDYYRWTQWFFLLLHERGLAYRATGSQWWCPNCQTILANEQVEHGLCWRCDGEVEKKDLAQWYFKITDYADRLIADLDTVDWPESIKTMQRNWIGRSEGVEVIFRGEKPGFSEKPGFYDVPVFTTRPDTLFGVTFLVLAPEHPLVYEIMTDEQRVAVSAYIRQAQRKSEIDRAAADKDKTGIFTGAYAVHPLTGERVPIWVADYVMMGYGTGAVMGVPGHDARDFAFAKTYNLPMVEVITPDGTPQDVGGCFSDYGVLINSGDYSGMSSQAAIKRITADLAAQNAGRPQVTYKLRDWLISRQRYWGVPIPMIHCESCGPVPVPKEALPVLLPDTDDFMPAGDGRSPLARIDDWVNTNCPQCGEPAKRETDTMDGFACSSWYFLRFASPHDKKRPFDPAAVRQWLPVNSYVGGAEHAVMHLLYARFWTKVIFDAGLIDFIEPFAQLRNQGMLLSPKDGQKMSKSKGNVITPDEVIARHGTDALRMYLLFLGPFDQDVLWDDVCIKGVTRFLDRFWRLVRGEFNAKAQRDEGAKEGKGDEGFERMRHKVVKRMTREMEGFRFNTAVAGLMEYLNYLVDAATADVNAAQWAAAIETFVKLLAPICPFIAEETWQNVMGRTGSVHQQAWPTFDEAMTVDDEIEVVVQINGRVRDRIMVAADVDEVVVRETAVATPTIQRIINGQPIRKVIVVRKKLVNIVV
ncbi:MAG: leucine--tRNA ligase [Anaerolineales bacterium]|nr:leucine--tRNA ligase [Anaerolineales bacterium]